MKIIKKKKNDLPVPIMTSYLLRVVMESGNVVSMNMLHLPFLCIQRSLKDY